LEGAYLVRSGTSEELGIFVINVSDPKLLKRQYFFWRFSVLMAVRYLISLLCHNLSLHFFGSCRYATSPFSIVLDGVFIEHGKHVTENTRHEEAGFSASH
jgi:hypothetical protein